MFPLQKVPRKNLPPATLESLAERLLLLEPTTQGRRVEEKLLEERQATIRLDDSPKEGVHPPVIAELAEKR